MNILTPSPYYNLDPLITTKPPFKNEISEEEHRFSGIVARYY